jgi:hypothetical protein
MHSGSAKQAPPGGRELYAERFLPYPPNEPRRVPEGGSLVTWRQTIANRTARDLLAGVRIPGNQENLDRLAVHMAGGRA